MLSMMVTGLARNRTLREPWFWDAGLREDALFSRARISFEISKALLIAVVFDGAAVVVGCGPKCNRAIATESVGVARVDPRYSGTIKRHVTAGPGNLNVGAHPKARDS